MRAICRLSLRKQTAVPLDTALASAAVAHSEIFDVGGVYTQHNWRRSGQCLSAEIVWRFPGLDVGRTPEARALAQRRKQCRCLVQWLRTQGSMVMPI